MRTASGLEDFLRAPRDACFEGRHLTFWNLGTVSGWRVFGAPRKEDGEQLVACIDTLYAPRAPRYWSLVDLRHLESVDEVGFEVLRGYVAKKLPRMRQRLVRQAVIKRGGLVGAMVAGFYVQLEPRHPVRVFDALAPAAKWLAPPDARALRTLLCAMKVPPRLDGELLPALHAWLREHRLRPTFEAAAQRLGLSGRTLQRRLREHDTTFKDQVRRVRVELAQQLLRGTDWKLAAIAQEVGFDSSQRLATSFRRHVGVTPTAFRDRYRAALSRQAGA